MEIKRNLIETIKRLLTNHTKSTLFGEANKFLKRFTESIWNYDVKNVL